MFAWLAMIPVAVASTVTLNFTVTDSATASVPPVVAFAPVPSRTVRVFVPAAYSPVSSPAASVLAPAPTPALIWIEPGT